MSSAAIPFTSRQLVRCVEKLRFPIPVPRLTTPWSRKRRQANLQQQLGFLAPVWENFSEMMADYVASNPPTPQNTQADVLDCLQWLRGHGSPTPLQLDYWLCQQAVWLLAQRKATSGLRYSQFALQCRQSILATGAAEWGPQAPEPLWIAVNPVHRWVSLSTPALLNSITRPPANVLLYATEREIRAAAFGLEGLALFNSLVDHEPCLLGDWATEVTLAGVDLLQEFCRELAGLGLVAVNTLDAPH